MKKSYRLLLVMFAMVNMIVNKSVVAQEAATASTKTIVRGKITDNANNQPIVNVSVTEVDADGRVIRGVSTDIDGNYALKINDLKHKIVVSYIGYATETIEIKGRTSINIKLKQGNKDLDEVIIIGNSKTSNGNLNISDKDLTIAASRVNAKDLEELGSATIDQALQGRMSGVDIVATSGDPGAGMSIRIRGTSSINAGTNPLIVVDGIPYETQIPSDFNFGTADDQGYAQLLNIAPSDIKDITVLKDAAGTAMWGARAANGVLLITTKRGNVSKPVLTYTARAILAKQPKPIPLLNGDQYSNLIPEMVMNRTGLPLNTLNVKEFAYDPSDPYFYYNYSQNTDWLAAITRLGKTSDQTLSMTGGGEKARYYASLSYFNQQGTTIGTDLNRITTRINLDYVVSDKIKFRTDFAYTYSDNPRNYYPGSANNEIRNVALNKMPNMSIYEYNEQGVRTPNYFSPAQNIQGLYPGTYNPVALANTATNRIISNRLIPRFSVQYDIIKKILVATSDVQFDINNTKSKSFLPQIATGRPTTETVVNRAYDGDVDGFNVQTKTNLVFTPKLPDDHSLTSLLSIQTYDNKTISNQALTSNTASSLLQDPSTPSRTQNQELNIGAGFTQTRTIGAVLNAQYGYKGKYIVNVGLRGDGNSRFGPNNRYGLFPSISTRWRVSGENFMKNVKFVSELSFRASYGQAGNAPRRDYSFYNQYSNFGWTYAGQAGTFPSSVELSSLKYEVVHGKNVGINLIMLKNRLNIDVEVYQNTTRDLIMEGLRIPTFNGYSSINTNAGVLDNQGWEVNIISTPFKNSKWTVNFNFNIAQNENVLREVSPFINRSSGDVTTNGSYLTLLQVNNPYGSIYGYRFKGVYSDLAATVATDGSGKPIVGPNGQNIYMRFNYPRTNYVFQPGDAKYEDINKDGNIDYRDVVYLGNSNPRFSGGFGPSITYKKSLTITAFFNYRTNFDVVNGTKITTTNMFGFNNQSTAVLRRWRNPGDVTDIPRALWATGFNWLGSDRYVEDASFLRFRSLTVRYNFSNAMLKKLKMKNLSTYLTAENIMTFTKYTGQDPEVAPRGIGGPFTVVTDNSTTPPVFSLTFGVVASF